MVPVKAAEKSPGDVTTQRSDSAGTWWPLLGLLSAGWLLRVLLWEWFPNTMWPDEIFQTLEQSHRLVFGYGLIPWEFQQGLRSWIFPGMLAPWLWLSAQITDHSWGYLLLVSSVLSLVAMIPVVAAYRFAQPYGRWTAWSVALFCCFWFEWVYFAPKALTEVVAAHILLGGLLAGYLAHSTPTQRGFFWTGLFLGFAFVLRIHLALGVAFAFVWLGRKAWRERWLPLLAGALLPILFSGVLDLWVWGTPFQSMWLQVWVNVVEGKSTQYGMGALPWYAYLQILSSVWSWFGIPLLGLGLLATRRFPLLAGVALLLLVSHSVIPHKEYRFIYPVVVLWITLAALGGAQTIQWLREYLVLRSHPHEHHKPVFSAPVFSAVVRSVAMGLIMLGVAASLWLALHFDNTRTLNHFGGPPTSHWRIHRGSLRSLLYLQNFPSLCGLAVLGMSVEFTGGYTYLHRKVPIVSISTKASEEKLVRRLQQANFLLASPSQPTQNIGIYQRLQCWDHACLYRREGRCRPAPSRSQ